MKDIYFEPNFGKLYEKVEKGICKNWKYEGPEGIVNHQFILREIPIETETRWYDIVTPYGYGGPVISKISEGYEKKELVSAFEKAFEEYCIKNKIVSEFVRFHTIVGNAYDFKEVYNAECIRHTVGTNLKTYEDPVVSEFSKNCRRNIRKALNNGVTYRVTPQPQHIDSFKEVYYSTMDRNNAGDYYYFEDEYFEKCMEWFGEELLFVEALYEEKVIAAGLYFISNKTIHIHLSGTLSEYLYLSPAYILRYAATLWGKEHGYEIIHHGGGRSNSPEDSLYKFKKQFGKNTEFEFFVGRKIWNQEMYGKLCDISGNDKNGEFFPAYRKSN